METWFTFFKYILFFTLMLVIFTSPVWMLALEDL